MFLITTIMKYFRNSQGSAKRFYNSVLFWKVLGMSVQENKMAPSYRQEMKTHRQGLLGLQVVEKLVLSL